MDKQDIITTYGDKFSHEESAQMAALIFYRFGRDWEVANNAWNRLLESNVRLSNFKELVILGCAIRRVQLCRILGFSVSVSDKVISEIKEELGE